MIKLQDFARECGVTDRQIHRLLSKYEDEVTGHFERQGQNGTWLDEVACNILRSKMKKLPPAVSDQQMNRDLQKLQEENKRLNEMLGAQGIMIGQMHQQIYDLQQFKLGAEKEKLRIEESREAQERRERELDQREANMVEEVRMAVQEAVEATERDLEGKHTQVLQNVQNELQGQLDAAIKVFDQEKKELEDQKHLLQQENEQLRNRTVWDYLFRRKGKG